jgi:hypothetical protein
MTDDMLEEVREEPITIIEGLSGPYVSVEYQLTT